MANEPLDKIWKGKGWSDGQPVTRMPQPDGSIAEGTAAYQYGYNPQTGGFSPLQIDPVSGALSVSFNAGGSPPPPPPPPPISPNKEPLDRNWKGKAWSDGAPVTRVPQSDGSISEAQAALAYAWNAGSSTYQKVPIDGTTGALQVAVVSGGGGTGPTGPPGPSVASYVVSWTGSMVVAKGTRSGLTDQSNADGGVVLQNCINALGAAGGRIVFTAGTYPWSSVPKLPPGLTGRLVIQGEAMDAVVITLSAAGPRFLDFNRTADYQTFQDIEITDVTVDCNNVDAATHTIIGDRVTSGVTDMRINFQQIAVRRVRAINIPATATRRSGISFGLRQQAGGEATLNFVRDLLFEDVTLEGGVYGFGSTGGDMSGGTLATNLNMLIDNIRFIRCRHLQPAGLPPVSGFSFQIGQNAPVGYCLLRDCYGENSLDVGVEIDNATRADIENCEQANCRAAFFATNFAPPQNLDAQMVVFRRCKATVTNPAVNPQTVCVQAQGNNSLPVGTVVADECVYDNTNNALTGANAPHAFQVGVSATTIRKFAVLNCKVAVTNLNYTSTTQTAAPIVAVHVQGATVGKLEVKSLDCRIAGVTTQANRIASRVIDIEAGGTVTLDIDGVDIDTNISGPTASGSNTLGIYINPGAALTVAGSIRRVRVISLGVTDTASRAVWIGSTANLTISPGPVLVEDCDLGAITGSTEIVADATQTALGAVAVRDIRWKTRPAPVGFTGLVTATGKRLGAQAATVIWRSLVQFVPGSGAGITAIDVSTNNGTTWTNLLTQAAGAMPAGTALVAGPLSPDAQIRVAFTTTQPTITLVPVFN